LKEKLTKILAFFSAHGRWNTLLAVTIMVASFIYFCHDLDSREPELNESQDIAIAHELFTTWMIPVDQSALYYVILNFWERLYPPSLAFLRVPSAFFGAITVMCVFLLVEAETGIIGGLLAALFLSVNPIVVYFARDARAYTLMMALAAGAMLFAYRTIIQTRKQNNLTAFIVFAVLGVHTHFFLLLFNGSLGILVVCHLLKNRQQIERNRTLRIVAIIGGLLIFLQLVRIFWVLRYTEARNSLYHGIEHNPLSFLKSIGLDFFMGYGKIPSHGSYVLLPIVLLIFIGIASLKRRGLAAGTIIIVPSLAISWYLSKDNPVSSRYILYLLPLLICFLAAGLARLRWVFLWGPLAFGLTAINVALVNSQYSIVTDWHAVGKYIESIRNPSDVVAVFPSFWSYTFEEYYRGKTIPFFYVEEIDRILARGKRIILVHSPGRYFGQIDAYLKKHVHRIDRYSTKIRAPIEVLTLIGEISEKSTTIDKTDPSLLLAGTVGSGGYPWQNKPENSNPFSRLSNLFKSSDLVVTGYEPYGIPWYRFFFTDFRELLSRRPNERVVKDMAASGIKAVALLASNGMRPEWQTLLDASGIKSIPKQAAWSKSEPAIFQIRNLKIGILYVGQHVFTDRPYLREKGDATLADLEKAVRHAKNAINPNGRLVVFLPAQLNYDRLFEKEDQMIARRAVDLGADVVVGMGGWAAKEIEEYKDGVIAYSLGTLLRPPSEPSCARNSSGFALRLSFPEGKKVSYGVIPVTFDDTYQLAYSRMKYAQDLHFNAVDSEEVLHLRNRLLDARVGSENRSGQSKIIQNWSASESIIESGKTITSKFFRLYDWWAQRYSNERPFTGIQEGYYEGNIFAAMNEACSNLECHRAIRLRPGDNAKIWIRFPKVLLGDAIRLNWAMADDIVSNTFKQFPQENLSISIDNVNVLSRKIDYVIGWRQVMIDTSSQAGQECEITVTLNTTGGKTFPVDIDPVLVQSPQNLQDFAEKPYRFDEHLREAKVTVENVKGDRQVCSGPDETFRPLTGGKNRLEEHGPYGEGVLTTRWYCGDMPWDAVALTMQKSGGELRRVIWQHPLKDKKRVLMFGPLTMQAEVQGFMGFTDLSIQKKTAPVEFSIYIGDQVIYRSTLFNKPGWTPFKATLPIEMHGQQRELSFIVETKNQNWCHFCFNAWMQ